MSGPADQTAADIAKVLGVFGADEQTITALVMVGWLPPAAEVRNGIAYWTDDGFDDLCTAFGQWLAFRAAETESAAKADAVIFQARQPR